VVTTPINSIGVDERGVAYIAGTRIKVRHIAVEAEMWEQTPEEIQAAHPQLSLGQVYAALAYYHDHKADVDAEIAESDRYAEKMRRQSPNPLSRAGLEARLSQNDHGRQE
jgi:uncharacterized protein (DUF433 family)